MYLAGFTINILTLLAIVLAIGLVVDDAIVVMENIYTKIEQGMSPLEAGFKGSNEIFFAVIATTIALVAVFSRLSFAGDDRAVVPGIQYRDYRGGHYFFICRTDFYPDDFHQVAYPQCHR